MRFHMYCCKLLLFYWENQLCPPWLYWEKTSGKLVPWFSSDFTACTFSCVNVASYPFALINHGCVCNRSLSLMSPSETLYLGVVLGTPTHRAVIIQYNSIGECIYFHRSVAEGEKKKPKQNRFGCQWLVLGARSCQHSALRFVVSWIILRDFWSSFGLHEDYEGIEIPHFFIYSKPLLLKGRQTWLYCFPKRL